MNLQSYLKKKKSAVDSALKKYFSKNPEEPAVINAAMRYSIFAGGKRLRPILCLAACEICGGRAGAALPTACGIEMIHTYSLVHDDLPAMDDDDYRRGKLTSHKKFGEAIAILAGDGLLTKAFEIIHPSAVGLIAASAGTGGMVGGQAADISASNSKSKTGNLKSMLEYIHNHKTAKMIEASLTAGAIIAGASKKKTKALSDYGRKTGLAFQIADDILDLTVSSKKLGKSASDLENGKLTYPAVYGIEKSRRKAYDLVESAKNDLRVFCAKAEMLRALADYIVKRDF